MKDIRLLLATTCFALVGGLGVANAAVTITGTSSGQFGTGYSNVATFNSIPAGTPAPFSDNGLDFSGMGQVVAGSSANQYAAPSGDTTNYLVLGGPGYSGTETITVAGGKSANSFGLYWGSIDSYNNITFLLNGTSVGSFSGSDVSASGDAFVNFSGRYDTVVLSSPQPNFETDNISVGGIPEPSTWAMMLLGFGGLAGLAYAQSKRASAPLIAV